MTTYARDNLTMVGLLAAAVGVAAATLYWPQSQELDRLHGQIASRRLGLDADARKATGVSDLFRQVQEMKVRYKDFDRRLPKQKELGSFLHEISTEMSDEKLANQLIEPGKPAREDLFHALPIIMKFNGSFLSLTSFLERIDRMERLTRVQKLVVADDPKTQKLDIELQLNIYFNEG